MARMSLENMLWKCESCGWQKKEPVPDAMMLPIYCPKCKQGAVKIRRLMEGDDEDFIELVKEAWGCDVHFKILRIII